MEYKGLKFSLGKIDDEGVFDGYASVTNVVDLGGDIVEPGAFTKSLSENDFFTVLDSHDPRVQLGIAYLQEDKKGLRVKRGELNMDVARAREVRSLMHQKAIRGISIGYDTIRREYDKDGYRRLKEIKLYEISPVAFPMNPKANVMNVKSMADLQAVLESILTMDIKSIEPANREMAARAIERIKTLLDEGAPSVDTHPNQAPSLEPLFAAVKRFSEQIEI